MTHPQPNEAPRIEDRGGDREPADFGLQSNVDSAP